MSVSDRDLPVLVFGAVMALPIIAHVFTLVNVEEAAMLFHVKTSRDSYPVEACSTVDAVLKLKPLYNERLLSVVPAFLLDTESTKHLHSRKGEMQVLPSRPPGV